MKRFLSHANLASLVDELTAANIRVIAPVRASDHPDQIDYRPITKLEEATFGVQLPRLSLKGLFLPATEVLLQYRHTTNGVEIQEIPTKVAPQVVIGATPCDVAGLEVVDKVMNWDYRDELWFGHRDATTIVTFLCSVMDSTCFCTAVGSGPDSFRGSDLLLTPVKGGYLADVASFKGEALLKNIAVTEPSAAVLAEAEAAATAVHQKVEENLPAIASDFPDWLAKNFDNPIWKTMSLRCHGCGACASVCPTCHCFDIADEHESSEQGVRRRNWDSCQIGQFTLHASGHNPRASQIERFRQRIMHKFSIYPRRFEEILCTGCGRCARVCPGGLYLPEIIGELTALAKAETERNAQ